MLTDVELTETVRSTWLDVLELADCADTDDFFDLGGNSLSAVLLVAQLEERLQVEVPLDAIFFEGTLAGVTAACARAAEQVGPDTERSGMGQ